MSPLRAGLHEFKPMGEREIDRLIVADFEMQKRMVLDASPIAAVKRIGTNEVECARNAFSIAAGKDEQNSVRHPLPDKREERSR